MYIFKSGLIEETKNTDVKPSKVPDPQVKFYFAFIIIIDDKNSDRMVLYYRNVDTKKLEYEIKPMEHGMLEDIESNNLSTVIEDYNVFDRKNINKYNEIKTSCSKDDINCLLNSYNDNGEIVSDIKTMGNALEADDKNTTKYEAYKGILNNNEKVEKIKEYIKNDIEKKFTEIKLNSTKNKILNDAIWDPELYIGLEIENQMKKNQELNVKYPSFIDVMKMFNKHILNKLKINNVLFNNLEKAAIEKGGKRKSRRNRKTKKGKRSRKARKSRRKSNRRR
jgi:hypothetical protein